MVTDVLSTVPQRMAIEEGQRLKRSRPPPRVGIERHLRIITRGIIVATSDAKSSAHGDVTAVEIPTPWRRLRALSFDQQLTQVGIEFFPLEVRRFAILAAR